MEAAGSVGERALLAAVLVGADVPVVGVPADGRTRVGVAVPGCAGRGIAALAAGAAASGLEDPPPVAAVAAGVKTCPPAGLLPRAAQPAVKVTAVSAAAVMNALACQARRLPFPRPACPPNLTRILPTHVRPRIRRGAAVPADNSFLWMIFRYLGSRVVSPSCDAYSSRG